MGLLEMIREYNELLDEKDGLKEATKRNNEAIDEKKKEIAQQMIDDDVPSISVGGYKFFLQDKTIYSKKSEEALMAASLDFLTVLREQGLGDIIQETVNPRTLQSTVKNLVEETGSLPEDLAEVLNVYDTYGRFCQNLVLLMCLTLVFGILSLLFVRRKRYASV